jgi:hypothetical protein
MAPGYARSPHPTVVVNGRDLRNGQGVSLSR